MRQGFRLSVVIMLFLSSSLTSGEEESPLQEDIIARKAEGFRDVGLRVHNYYRTSNKARELQLDQELNKRAHAHAEKQASLGNMVPSKSGFYENLWSHKGELLPLSKDLEYAIKCWYTGSMAPGRVQASVDHYALRSNDISKVGFGVGTSDHNGEGYTVVVAFYE